MAQSIPPGVSEEEAQLREACLKIQNDPRLSVGQKRWQISMLTGEVFGAMSTAELYGRHTRDKG